MELLFIVCIILIIASIFKYSHVPNGCFDVRTNLPVRGILALLICWHHICLEYSTQNDECQQFKLWGGVIVSIFFFMSGYGLIISYRSKENYLDGFIKNAIIKLGLPVLTLSVCYIFVCSVGNCCYMSINDIIYIFYPYLGGTVLPKSWFVYELLILYALFYVVFKNKNFSETNKLKAVFVLVAILCCFFVISGYGSNWYISTFSFPLGLLYASIESKLKIFLNKKRSNLVFFSILPLIPFPLYFTIYYLYDSIILYPLICLTTPLVLPVSEYYLNPINIHILRWLGGISFEIYLIHGAIIKIVAPINNSMSLLMFSFLLFTITIILAFFFNKLHKRIIHYLR